MADTSRDFLQEAFEEAKSCSKRILRQCEEIQEDYVRNDRLYVNRSAFNQFVYILLICLGVAGFVFYGTIHEFLTSRVIGLMNLEGFLEVLPQFLRFAFVGLILYGAINMYLVFHSKKAKLDLWSIEKIADGIKKETEGQHLEDISGMIFSNPASVKVGSGKNHELSLRRYTDRMAKIGKTTKLASGIFYLVLYAVLLIVFMASFAMPGLGLFENAVTYASIATLGFAYVGILGILFCFMVRSYEFIGKFAKPLSIVLFLICQLIYFLKLQELQLFSGFFMIDYPRLAEKTAPALAAVVTFLADYIATKGGILLILTTWFGLMYLVRTNPEREYTMCQEGISIPLDNGNKMDYSAEKIRRGHPGTYTFMGIFVLLGSALMAWSINRGVSFLTVIIYAGLAFAWFALRENVVSSTDMAMYGKRMKWLTLILFLLYVVLTCCLLEELTLIAVILLLLQVIIVFFAIALFFMFI